ncbi:MAG TPA: UDP-N-acetylmuramoyl-L-alanyl-D-glutamate--2,6-diaminopimelate ligase [Polyangia bacterium]|jgi:UDP-N-acetylmuramoyl-L-alanyl-D-glutamate--2,6-diaminopimelate ligase|nr:UDP-N-acetylmuramoyl-L-alanyl-D-glutamate--2,6-diaminopimelate ligase [Polyangia bacterium]
MTARLSLAALLAGVDHALLPTASGTRVDARDVEVSEVRDDSRRVGPGDLFVAVPGAAVDGTAFIADAFSRGARVVVTQSEPSVEPTGDGLLVAVTGARRALAIIAANRYGAAAALDLIAVTGTNGKTTTTYLVESMLAAAGRVAGVVGTVSYRSAAWPAGARERPAPLTTPGALALHGLFADMQKAGTTDVVLEASSHALDQGRLDGCRFHVAGMTNLTQDHLDYHVSMDRYFDAKAILFERLLHPENGVAVLMTDDDAGRRMRARVSGPVVGVTLQAAGAGADIAVARRQLSAAGMRLSFETPVGPIDIATALVGEFNLANIALAVGIGVARGLPAEAIATGIGRVAAVPGRLERVDNDRGVLCVVDYAHTPDALERAIAALRPLTAGRLLVVFGCGGDRDRSKRPLMGEAAARDADVVVVTSDNPRTEQPDAIVDMVLEGVRRVATPELDARALGSAARGYHRQVDRRTAIRVAAAAARAGEVLLIAGKGHEDYQIIGTTKTPFDDRREAAAALSGGVAGPGVTPA